MHPAKPPPPLHFRRRSRGPTHLASSVVAVAILLAAAAPIAYSRKLGGWRTSPALLRGTAPRLVVTSSEVHDPTTAGGKVGHPAGLGDLAGLRQGPGAAMLDGGPFNAEKAYKDSKLCNLLMARELERQLREEGQSLPVLAWSPGLVIPRSSGGGFFRYSRSQNPFGQALFALVARDLLRLTETPQRAGGLLAGLATTTVPMSSCLGTVPK